MLLIEHDLAAAFKIVDKITAMKTGRIVAEGTPDEIRQESASRKSMRAGASGPRCPGVTSDAMLAVEDIHTYYGESYVLQGISLTVERGRIAAVLGRNGVGKTTLIRSTIAFTPPRRGRVVFDGKDVTRWPSYRIGQAGMGLVPQGRRIFPSLSVRKS